MNDQNKKLDIALIGYGRMGHELEDLAKQRGHRIHCIIDSVSDWETQREQLKTADVAIEFTTPEQAPENLKKCFQDALPVVCGTTGWQNEYQDVAEYCMQLGGSLLYASNFSLGMQVLFALNRKLAGIMNSLPDYQVNIEEIHHTRKLDAPSGTAVSLASDIMAENPFPGGWILETSTQKAARGQLGIQARREAEVCGTHRVIYRGPFDQIELQHIAHNRRIFAEGAMLAAEWLPGRSGLYSMQDLINH